MADQIFPLVSIIIPAYNRADLIGETLESVIAQTYLHWECIVVDDHSTDATLEVVEEYCRKDNRIKLYKRPEGRPKGANACRNYGFEISFGKYICFLDSDDLLYREKIELQIQHFQNESNCYDCAAVVSNTELFITDEKIRRVLEPFDKFIYKEPLTVCLINKTVVWAISAPLWARWAIPDRPFNESLKSAQEWFFHVKQSLSLESDQFEFIFSSTVLIRRDNPSISRDRFLTNERIYTFAFARLELLKIVRHIDDPIVLLTAKREVLNSMINLLSISHSNVYPLLIEYVNVLSSARWCSKFRFYIAIFIFRLTKRGRKYIRKFGENL